ncbi:MAG: hypothetical protein V9E88_09980 [Ferruginibacter sp.]
MKKASRFIGFDDRFIAVSDDPVNGFAHTPCFFWKAIWPATLFHLAGICYYADNNYAYLDRQPLHHGVGQKKISAF